MSLNLFSLKLNFQDHSMFCDNAIKKFNVKASERKNYL